MYCFIAADQTKQQLGAVCLFPFALWGLSTLGTLQNFCWAFFLSAKNGTDVTYPTSILQHWRYYL